MKLCVAIPCFFKGVDFCEAIRAVGDLGFDTVETYDWKGLDISAVRKTLDDCGVDLLSMCTTEFRMTSPEHRVLWLDGLKESCEAANKLGVKHLITQVGRDVGTPREKQHESILEALEAAKPILASSGVTLMLEPLNTLVNHPGYYLWSAYEGFDIIRKVDHPNIKLIYDIYHQQVMEGNIIPNIINNLDCIAHLHSAGHPGRNELQFGENDYKVIISAIEKSGYDGVIALEYFPRLDRAESLRLTKQLYSH